MIFSPYKIDAHPGKTRRRLADVELTGDDIGGQSGSILTKEGYEIQRS
jgi:hypothetical protein